MNVAQSTAPEPSKPQPADDQILHAVPAGEQAHERPADIEALVQRLHAKWGNRQPGTGASGR